MSKFRTSCPTKCSRDVTFLANDFFFQYLCGKAEQNLFSRSSSTSGTDSSIRIRKTRAGCTERKWFISVSLAMIFTVLVASAGIYFGCELIFGLCLYSV